MLFAMHMLICQCIAREIENEGSTVLNDNLFRLCDLIHQLLFPVNIIIHIPLYIHSIIQQTISLIVATVVQVFHLTPYAVSRSLASKQVGEDEQGKHN